ncbi:helix-turn-helix transcriptional regulator [Nocardiopsis sediminis]|uniref:Helix-turn-helix transcriptional regulator n=1 Tax=Nocardiopsis sediminis TaxID=1778267 RepID=A0ABV8FJ10_9ACTN
MPDNDLGDFLRSRRARLRPEDVDMLSSGTRRVAGLRREEIAVLADVNVDYYTRLEQGRERRPSAQMVDALRRALRLDEDEAAHLHRLAGTVPLPSGSRPPHHVSAGLRQLLDGYSHTPALVLNRGLDVLATNPLADALFSAFAPVDNLARMAFVHPAGRGFYRDWNRVARSTVANLRHATGHEPGDPHLAALVAELAQHSPRFAELWAEHDVRGKSHEAKRLLHPDVGPLTLDFRTFDVREAPGQQLVIYHAEPGSESHQALNLLETLHATRAAEHGPAHLTGSRRA